VSHLPSREKRHSQHPDRYASQIHSYPELLMVDRDTNKPEASDSADGDELRLEPVVEKGEALKLPLHSGETRGRESGSRNVTQHAIEKTLMLHCMQLIRLYRGHQHRHCCRTPTSAVTSRQLLLFPKGIIQPSSHCKSTSAGLDTRRSFWDLCFSCFALYILSFSRPTT